MEHEMDIGSVLGLCNRVSVQIMLQLHEPKSKLFIVVLYITCCIYPLDGV